MWLTDEPNVALDLYEKLRRAKAHVIIPHTVHWRFGHVAAYFFSPHNDRKHSTPRILKKKRLHVHAADFKQLVYDAFSKKSSKRADDIVARLVHPAKDSDATVVRHLTVAQLHFFLFGSPEAEQIEALLQKYEPPPHKSYAMAVRCHWSRHTMHIECRTNAIAASNSNVAVEKRLATFEGPCRYSLPCSGNDLLERQVRAQSAAVAAALDAALDADGKKTWKMTLTFVPSGSGRYLLSWGSRSEVVAVDATSHRMKAPAAAPAAAAVAAAPPIADAPSAVAIADDGAARSQARGRAESLDVRLADVCDAVASPRAPRSPPRDGSIFHIRKPGMVRYERPPWMRPSSAGEPVPQPSHIRVQRAVGGLSSPRSPRSRIAGVDLREQKMWSHRDAVAATTVSTPRLREVPLPAPPPLPRPAESFGGRRAAAAAAPRSARLSVSMVRAAKRFGEVDEYLARRPPVFRARATPKTSMSPRASPRAMVAKSRAASPTSASVARELPGV